MTFHDFVVQKKPLWQDETLHLTLGEMFRLHDEWILEEATRASERREKYTTKKYPVKRGA